MENKQVLLEAMIRKKSERLTELACAEDLPLSSGIVLEKSQELDELINWYLKAKYEEMDVEKQDDMLFIKQQLPADQQVRILYLYGCLDYSTVGKLEEVVDEWKDSPSLEINFSGLEFIDSSGIGKIIEIIHKGKLNNQQISLTGMTGHIGNLVEAIGIIRVIDAIQN